MSEDVTKPQAPIALRGGSEVVIRPIAASDGMELTRAGGFGERSVYLRFLGSPPKPTRATLSYLTEVDHHSHEALVAMTPDGRELLGVARFVRDGVRSETAEAAIIVADEWQRRGLGRTLLERLALRAREEGISRFKADVLPENSAVLALLEELGEIHVERGVVGTMTVTIELTADRAGGAGLLAALRAAAAGEVRLSGLDWRGAMKEVRTAWRALRP